MEKLKLFSINKEEDRVQFIIEKNQKFIPIIKQFIEDINGETDWYLFDTDNKSGQVNINDWTDTCNYGRYKNYELQIFVGKNKVILIVRSSLKNQKKFVDKFMKLCNWMSKTKKYNK